METEPLEFEKPIVTLERQLADLRDKAADSDIDMESEVKKIEDKLTKTKLDIYNNLTPWNRVQIARHQQRPFMLDYVREAFDEFVELHGDRHVGDDEAMPGGLAYLEGRRVVLIGHQKGRDTKENLHRNFGSAHPEGYRKALRLMKLAEKFMAPVVTLIDTPGAYPGIGAEERNIAEAIAFNLKEMMTLSVPIISVVIGEGGSGGALGIGVADRVLMLENAYYSVISPEGCAAILWKERSKAPEAAECLKLTSGDLVALKIVDDVVKEPLGGAHRDPSQTAENIKTIIKRDLGALKAVDKNELIKKRYEKFRKIGIFKEAKSG